MNFRERLLQLATDLLPLSDGTTWYAFGSILRAPTPAHDVDLLIVTDTVEKGIQLRAAILEAPFPIPIDLVTMTEEEATELEFVSRTGAEQVFPPHQVPVASDAWI